MPDINLINFMRGSLLFQSSLASEMAKKIFYYYKSIRAQFCAGKNPGIRLNGQNNDDTGMLIL